jgi:triosephosphate isomerase
MKRMKVIAGNWKLYNDNNAAKVLATNIKEESKNIAGVDIILCPPFTALTVVADVVKNSSIAVGAQNVYWEKSGAFTGEISAEMIKSTGASYVIIGHSERRQYFWETDETVNKRINAALSAGLNPIVCVGEVLQERETGVTEKVIEKQISGALNGLNRDQMSRIIIAYEPVWAIGTGKTATPDQAQDVHRHIRSLIEKQFGKEVALTTRIQYGGSVKADNAKELLNQSDIDGALVGGACLKAETFIPIIKSAL